MAEYHVRAVQKYSKVSDQVTRHVLECIALDIGYGENKPATTGYRSIAKRLRISKSEVSRCIEDLVGTGELICNKVEKYHTYNLNPELIPYHDEVTLSGRSDDYKTRLVDNAIVTKKDMELLVKNLTKQIDDTYGEIDTKLSQVSLFLSQLSQATGLNEGQKYIERKEEEEENNQVTIDSPELDNSDVSQQVSSSFSLDRKDLQDNTSQVKQEQVNDYAFEVPIPDELNIPEFLEVWSDFIKCRAEMAKANKKKRPMTKIAQKRRLNALVKEHKRHGMDRVIFELDLAIQKQWEKPFFTNDSYYKSSKRTNQVNPWQSKNSTGWN